MRLPQLTFGKVLAGTAVVLLATTGTAFAAANVTSADIVNGTIQTVDIKNNAVTAAKIADGAVGSSEIINQSVKGTDITDGTVGSIDILNETIRTADILNGEVTNPDLGPDSVTSAKVLNETLTTSDILNGTIGAVDIAVGGVTSSEILDGSVTADDLAPNSVGTSEIQTDGVQASEIANDSIDSGEIIDFSLTNQDVGVLFAQVNANGTLANSSGGVTSSPIGTGTYEVDFGRNITSCAYFVTQGEAGVGGAGGAITGATDRAGNGEAVFATTRDAAGALVNSAFQLLVVC